jgi:surface antigen/peptidoglycan hydrolase CwlO-like protein
MSHKKKQKTRTVYWRRWTAKPLFVLIAALAAGCLVTAPFVSADSVQDQINSLQSQNSQSQSTVNSLQSQAASYQDAINQLQAQVDGLQSSITINQNKQAQLQQQIDSDQTELAQQKQVLGDDIKAMYVDGQMTTVEELATSKSLSDFVDAETYRNAVQDKIQQTLAQITQLEGQLKDQKTQVDQLISVQTQQQNQLATTEAQQSQLLSLNQTQQASYNQQIQSNQQQIATLRAEQIAANRKLVSGGQVDATGSCGGSYPATASGPYGNWGCNYGLDNTIDNWGMYNRECVSYTAWMVYKTYGYMPYWGGSGNANEWPGDAQAAGIPTGSTPKVNSVAIYMGGSSDPFGHAMWVKSVNGDGTITVDQYNLYYDGNFYETTIPSTGLTYIYFGQ